MATQRIGIREFRESLSTYLLQSQAPIAITRHGDTVGYYIPTRKRRTPEQREASRRSHEKMQQMLAEKGITEEEIIRDIDEVLNKKKKRK